MPFPSSCHPTPRCHRPADVALRNRNERPIQVSWPTPSGILHLYLSLILLFDSRSRYYPISQTSRSFHSRPVRPTHSLRTRRWRICRRSLTHPSSPPHEAPRPTPVIHLQTHFSTVRLATYSTPIANYRDLPARLLIPPHHQCTLRTNRRKGFEFRNTSAPGPWTMAIYACICYPSQQPVLQSCQFGYPNVLANMTRPAASSRLCRPPPPAQGDPLICQ
jgi:hypothetical protein